MNDLALSIRARESAWFPLVLATDQGTKAEYTATLTRSILLKFFDISGDENDDLHDVRAVTQGLVWLLLANFAVSKWRHGRVPKRFDSEFPAISIVRGDEERTVRIVLVEVDSNCVQVSVFAALRKGYREVTVLHGQVTLRPE